jgi:uncharacterized protein (DUF924 family)
MARDLGSDGSQVHDQAAAVLDFWLVETSPAKHFAVDPAVDAACAARFGVMRDAVLAHHAVGWRGDAQTLLAAVILLDQFSRNIFRDDPRAYEADQLARALAREALAKGWDGPLDLEQRRFLYMPFMHAENIADQMLSLRLFADDPVSRDYARTHARQIARFGRFPERNAVLGRESTAAEEVVLEEPGSTL